MRRCCAFIFVWWILIFSFTNGFQETFGASSVDTNFFSSSASGFFNWLFRFHQWDARWYYSIALNGHGHYPQSFVFPPGWGWLLGSLATVVSATQLMNWDQAFCLSALLIGVSSFALGNYILVELAHQRFGISQNRAWFGALANPVGYFALTSYSDAFFFFISTLVLRLALKTSDRKDLWKLDKKITRHLQDRLALASLIFIAPWIRLTGFAFGVWVFLKRRVSLSLVVSGALFLFYYWLKTDRPFYFLMAQEAFGMPEGYFLTGLTTCLKKVLDGFVRLPEIAAEPSELLRGEFYLRFLSYGLLPLLVFASSAAVAIQWARHREFLISSFLVATILITHNQGLWRSTPRYMFIVYPMIHILILASESAASRALPRGTSRLRLTSMILACLMFCAQVLYARQFQSGGWAF